MTCCSREYVVAFMLYRASYMPFLYSHQCKISSLALLACHDVFLEHAVQESGSANSYTHAAVPLVS